MSEQIGEEKIDSHAPSAKDVVKDTSEAPEAPRRQQLTIDPQSADLVTKLVLRSLASAESGLTMVDTVPTRITTDVGEVDAVATDGQGRSVLIKVTMEPENLAIRRLDFLVKWWQDIAKPQRPVRGILISVHPTAPSTEQVSRRTEGAVDVWRFGAFLEALR